MESPLAGLIRRTQAANLGGFDDHLAIIEQAAKSVTKSVRRHFQIAAEVLELIEVIRKSGNGNPSLILRLGAAAHAMGWYDLIDRGRRDYKWRSANAKRTNRKQGLKSAVQAAWKSAAGQTFATEIDKIAYVCVEANCSEPTARKYRPTTRRKNR